MSQKCMPEPDDINMYVNDLTVFYTIFDDSNFHAECNEMLNVVNNKNYQNCLITREDVSLALSSAQPGMACGPDNICGKVVEGCKEQLVTPMLRLYQFSLDNFIVPSMWKTSEIVPIPKNKIPLSKNDLRTDSSHIWPWDILCSELTWHTSRTIGIPYDVNTLILV